MPFESPPVGTSGQLWKGHQSTSPFGHEFQLIGFQALQHDVFLRISTMVRIFFQTSRLDPKRIALPLSLPFMICTMSPGIT